MLIWAAFSASLAASGAYAAGSISRTYSVWPPMIIWPCRVRLISWAWWSSMRRMIWLDRIRGLMRSVSVRPSSRRIAAPAARTSACEGEWISSRPKKRSMICMPGLTSCDLSAMSVSRLISMPGETSMYSEASPGSGRKPCATVPRNAAYCAWRLSRKT